MILAIIQARLGSTRLPGKVLLPLNGSTVIQNIIQRVKACKFVSNFVVATTDQSSDDELANFLEERELLFFRGSENDVLDRFYQCAKRFGADVIVRITADDPLKDPDIVDYAIQKLKQNPNLDYCSNTIKPTFPEGLDVEVFKFSALEKAWKEARLPSEREHVTPYIWKHPETFNVENFEHSEDLSHWRWTLDHEEDYNFINNIYKRFGEKGIFSYKEVIEFLKKDNQQSLMNLAIKRNEGYLKSLEKEREHGAN